MKIHIYILYTLYLFVIIYLFFCFNFFSSFLNSIYSIIIHIVIRGCNLFTRQSENRCYSSSGSVLLFFFFSFVECHFAINCSIKLIYFPLVDLRCKELVLFRIEIRNTPSSMYRTQNSYILYTLNL